MKSSSPFSDSSFRKWFGAETFLTLSTCTTLATSLMVIDLTKSVALTGTIGSIIAIVDFAAGVLGGGMADLQPRRRLISSSVLTALIGNLLLALLLVGHQIGAIPNSSFYLPP